MAAYIAFFAAYFSFFLLLSLKNVIGEDKASLISFIIAPNLIAPLLVFIAYRFIYKYEKSKFTLSIVFLSTSLLLTLSVFIFCFIDSLESNMHIRSINLFLIWQIIMALALQLIIYQEQILLKRKKIK